MGPLGTDYLEVHGRIDALVRPLGSADGVVPATPEWTVHDVIAHLVGITDDALAGRMEGAPGAAWTGAQVERGRGLPTAALLGRWAEQAPTFAGFLDPAGEYRAVFDIVTHWLDLAGALGATVDRSDRLVVEHARFLVDGLAWVTVQTPSGRSGTGGVTVTTSEFEVMRSRFGRRSRAQVLAYDWSSDPTALLDDWFIFGPAERDLDE